MKNIKNILSLILLIISFSKTSFSQQWEEQTIGSAVKAIDFINPNYGWAAMQDNIGVKVMKTLDKGISWSLIYQYYGNYGFPPPLVLLFPPTGKIKRYLFKTIFFIEEFSESV